jgi:DNA repair protein RadC
MTKKKELASNDSSRGHRNRVRERFLKIPAENFQDYEILEMLLFLANPRSDTKPIAKDLLGQMQNFENIVKASPLVLKKFNQVGDSTVFIFKLINEINNRINRSKSQVRDIFHFNDNFLESYRLRLKSLPTETLILLFLNKKNFIISEKIIDGGLDQTNIGKKKILEYAIASSCESLVLMHNHPTSTAQPSKADIKSTNIIESALKVIDIRIWDHVIFGIDDIFSFRDSGYL